MPFTRHIRPQFVGSSSLYTTENCPDCYQLAKQTLTSLQLTGMPIAGEWGIGRSSANIQAAVVQAIAGVHASPHLKGRVFRRDIRRYLLQRSNPFSKGLAEMPRRNLEGIGPAPVDSTKVPRVRISSESKAPHTSKMRNLQFDIWGGLSKKRFRFCQVKYDFYEPLYERALSWVFCSRGGSC